MRSLSVYESHKIRRLIKNERKARRTALVSDSKRGELGWLLPKREFKNAQLTLWEPCNKRLMIYRIAQNRSDRCCVRVVPALRSVRRFQSEDSGMLRAYDLPKSAPWMRLVALRFVGDCGSTKEGIELVQSQAIGPNWPPSMRFEAEDDDGDGDGIGGGGVETHYGSDSWR